MICIFFLYVLFTLALNLLKNACEKDPKDSKSLALYAMLQYSAFRNVNLAQRYLQKVVTMSPFDAESLYFLAKILYEKGFSFMYDVDDSIKDNKKQGNNIDAVDDSSLHRVDPLQSQKLQLNSSRGSSKKMENLKGSITKNKKSPKNKTTEESFISNRDTVENMLKTVIELDPSHTPSILLLSTIAANYHSNLKESQVHVNL